MRGLVLLLLCTCACKQVFGLDEPIVADGGSSKDDGSMIAGDAQQCWSLPQLAIDFCLPAPLGGTETIEGDVVFSTEANGSGPGMLGCEPTIEPLCVIAADSIAITESSHLVVHGPRPLVFVANTIAIDGILDVASHIGGMVGPAANARSCLPGTNPSVRGGGAGGSFGTRGGSGGDQDGMANTGGTPGPAVALTSFQAGCPGTNGGGTVNNHGSGGGAVALFASSITLGPNAVINASGAGGGPGGADDGGSGAGSGGLIVFKTPSIAASDTSQVYANGGGGGGAGSTNVAGEAGRDPTSALEGGFGGQGAGSDSGDGGDGFPAGPSARDGLGGQAMSAAGGGGAGGAGIIRVYGTMLTGATVSPPPS